MVGAEATQATSVAGFARTIFVAGRSAISALALIAIFDREFVASQWLHWALLSWKSLIHYLFGWLPFRVHEEAQPFLAFTLIVAGTLVADVVLRRRGISSGWGAKTWSQRFLVLRLLLAALLLVLAGLGVGVLSHEAFLETTAPPPTAEQLAEAEQGCKERIAQRPPEGHRRWRYDPKGERANEPPSYEPYPTLEECTARVARGLTSRDIFIIGIREPGQLHTPAQQLAISLQYLLSIVLAAAILAAPYMFLWMFAFVATFLGVDQLALHLGQALPRPPS